MIDKAKVHLWKNKERSMCGSKFNHLSAYFPRTLLEWKPARQRCKKCIRIARRIEALR